MMKKSIISSALAVHLCAMAASAISIPAVYAADTFYVSNTPNEKGAYYKTQPTSSELAIGHSAEKVPSTSAIAQWLPELMQSFEKLPEVQSQTALKRQALIKVSAADNAVYNPELGLDYQYAPDDDTYTIAVSQTIDWSDKRGAAIRVAQLESEIVLTQISTSRSQLLSQQLLALVTLQQQQKLLTFNQQQFDLARAQLALAEQRVEAGDIALVELQLMRLDVANNAAELAIAEQALINAETSAYSLYGSEFLPHIELMGLIDTNLSQEVDSRLPALKSLYQQVMLSKLSVGQLKAELAQDPSISLSAEREGSDNKFGVGISIPLSIRNDYSDTLNSANEGIAIAEQNYLASERALYQQWRQFNRGLPRLLARYQDWIALVELSGQEAAASLSVQWQSGDIGTSEYLQSQRQMSSSVIAGLSLEASLYQQWLSWMGDSGQLEKVLLEQLPGQQNQAQFNPDNSQIKG